MPKGLKPVRKRLAGGAVQVYWYHRATGKRLKHDPETADGFLEVAALDREADKLKPVAGFLAGTYAALWALYRESPEWRKLKPRTRSDYQAVRDWIGPVAEKLYIVQITPAALLRLRDKAAAQRGMRFANYVVQVLRLTLEWGIPRELVRENAARKVELIRRPKGKPKVNRAWSDAEVEAFAAAAPPQLVVPFALGLFAGMREGDALIVTRRAYDGATLRWIASKNGEECSAPVAGSFKLILDGAVEQAKAAARKDRARPVQLALTSRGTAWTESGFRASFFRLVRELQAAGALQPGCTFHGLRHTIARHAREDGQSDSRVAAAIGDRSPAMAQIYGRDADRGQAQTEVLQTVQKRFGNIDWKLPAR